MKIRVYSGEDYFVTEKRYRIVERQGRWYAPYLGALITAAGRLLLGMLEKEVALAGGTYAWADTDALAIVSLIDGGPLPHVLGCKEERALSWAEVDGIRGKFERLNPYSFSGTILKLIKENYVGSDPTKDRRQLYGFSISAKRYALYEWSDDDIVIVSPKAHGLGYLHPPVDSPSEWDQEHDVPKWIFDFWDLLLRTIFRLRGKPLSWLLRPQIMRMAATTHDVLKRLNRWPGFRPYNLFSIPVLANNGYPGNVDPDHFALATRYEPVQEKWFSSVCINMADSTDEREYRITTDFASPKYGECAVVDNFRNLLNRYFHHPEAKSLDFNNEPCKANTKGLLKRTVIIAGTLRRIGKESDRRWEEGDDLESMERRPVEYSRKIKSTARPEGESTARESLIVQIREIGIRELMRNGFARRTLYRILRRQAMKKSVIYEYERRIIAHKQLR